MQCQSMVVDITIKTHTIMAEIILFNNYDPCEKFDEVKQEYVDENLSESQIWEIVSEWEREEWDTAIKFLKSNIKGKVLAKGTIGTWRGNFDGINTDI